MRKEVARKKRIRAGKLVRIHVVLRPAMERARVSVWAAENGGELAPYVDPAVAQVIQKGKPTFARPFHRNINDQQRSHVFELTTEYKTDIVLMQEVDRMSDVSPRVRIKTYGTFAQRFRWYCRKLVGLLRYSHAAKDGRD